MNIFPERALGIAIETAQNAQSMPYGWHMHDWASSWGMWPMLIPFLLLLAVVVGVVFLMQTALFERRRDPDRRTASDILDERYARGDIDHDEYVRRKHDIQEGLK